MTLRFTSLLLNLFLLSLNLLRSSAQNTFYQWVPGSATFYLMANGGNSLAGACAYSGTNFAGIGIFNAAAASFLWKKGMGCGACYEVKCDPTKNRPEFCLKGKTVSITVTNMCPRGGVGWCNPPRKHLDMSVPAFLKIAIYRAGYVNTWMRRIPCKRSGSIKFKLGGNPWFFVVTVYNIAGFAELRNVYIQVNKPGRTWYLLRRNWGALYSRSHNFNGQPLNIRLVLLNGQSLLIKNALPKGWHIGATYSAGQFSSGKSGRRKFANRNLRSTQNRVSSMDIYSEPSPKKIQLQLNQKMAEAREILQRSSPLPEPTGDELTQISQAKSFMEAMEETRVGS